jgi:hypothetical protein
MALPNEIICTELRFPTPICNACLAPMLTVSAHKRDRVFAPGSAVKNADTPLA